MSKAIWKYPLEPDQASIYLPVGAEILCVQVQGSEPCLWALVDPATSDKETRHIGIYGTGHRIEGDPGRYIGTFQLNGGTLVFHVFDEGS